MEPERKRYRISIATALITAALAIIWLPPSVGAEQETFTTQCAGGIVEVWPSYTGTGQLSYFRGQGRVTVDFSFPEDGGRVTLVAISTGSSCTAVEIRTRSGSTSGGGTVEIPEFDFNLPAGSASFGAYDHFGDFEYSGVVITARTPSGERLVVKASNGATLVGGPDQALEVASPDGTICHNGRFYYGIDATNGNTWTSGCVTDAVAASYGWDTNNSSVSYPDQNEVYETLSSGLPGWRYEHWVGGQQVGHIGCVLRRLNLGSEYREFACTMP